MTQTQTKVADFLLEMFLYSDPGAGLTVYILSYCCQLSYTQ